MACSRYFSFILELGSWQPTLPGSSTYTSIGLSHMSDQAQDPLYPYIGTIPIKTGSVKKSYLKICLPPMGMFQRKQHTSLFRWHMDNMHIPEFEEFYYHLCLFYSPGSDECIWNPIVRPVRAYVYFFHNIFVVHSFLRKRWAWIYFLGFMQSYHLTGTHVKDQEKSVLYFN